MIRLATTVIWSVSVVTVVAATQCAAQELMPLSAPVTPHPLDRNMDDQIVVSFFSFGPDVEDQIHRIDDDAADMLQRPAGPFGRSEVFVALASDWKQASLIGVGLFADMNIVNHFDALIGTDKMVDLNYFPEHNYHEAMQSAVFLTEFDGQPVTDECLALSIVATLYLWSEKPVRAFPLCTGGTE